MSASREKKKRQEQTVAAANQPVETKKGMSKGAKTALTIVVSVVLVAAIVFFAMIGSGFFEAHTTAAVVNGHKITPAMANYYYTSIYNDTTDSLSYMADMTKPLAEQPYLADESITWADYIMDYAMMTASQIYAYHDDAVANGFTLSEEGQSRIDAELESLETYAKAMGYASGDSLLAATYGAGCNMKNYEEYLYTNALANEYDTAHAATLTYTDEDLAAYYAENPDNIDAVNFRLFNLPAEIAEGETTPTEEALAAAEDKAKSMAESSKNDEQAFIDLAYENAAEDLKSNYEDDSATLLENFAFENCLSVYRDWLKDPSRQEGDTTYISNNSTGFYVLYYIGRADQSFFLPNVRHILLSLDDTTDAETLKAQAEAILAEFEAGEKTEDAFAALVSEHSTDTASVEAGGLYEEIYPGQMVEAFDNWCFDATRAVGDTGIVETEYGYHIMYYVGTSDVTYQDYLIDTALFNRDYLNWQAEVTANNDYSIHSIKFVETR